MEDQFYTAFVDASIADLIPEYLNNRRKEVRLLKGCLSSEDFARIAEVAHRMVGVGTPYGFHHVTNLARVIRETALAKDADTLRELLKEYEHYIEHVVVKIRKD